MPTTAVHASVHASMRESVRESVRTHPVAAPIVRTFRSSRTQLILKGRRQQYVVRTAHMQHIAHLNCFKVAPEPGRAVTIYAAQPRRPPCTQVTEDTLVHKGVRVDWYRHGASVARDVLDWHCC